MKLFHLSDLHLGRRLHEYSMLEDQRYILDEILALIEQEKPDGVLIAGDVYDKSTPSVEAVTLLDDFLTALSVQNVPVCFISGNHDSAERVAFGGRLLGRSGVYVSPVYDGTVMPLELRDEYGPVFFWLLPFFKPAQVRRFFPDNTIESYTDALRLAVRQMPLDPAQRNILVAHQFVSGSVRCESEEVSVGGTDCVDAAVFEGFDYVALGHLHGPQNLLGGKLRYCGTPLKYSFSEAGQQKSVTVVELGEKGAVSLCTLPLTPLHELREIRGTFEELTRPAFYLGTDLRESYLHITLTDEEDISEAKSRLGSIYHRILWLDYDNCRTRSTQSPGAPERVEEKTPLALFEELYEKQNNQPMRPEQTALLETLIEEIWGNV